MERLTEDKQIGPWASLKDKAEAIPGAFANYDCLMAHMTAVTRLKYYEDLEEQGLLVVLPCKVGSIVYIITGLWISEYTVQEITVDDMFLQFKCVNEEYAPECRKFVFFMSGLAKPYSLPVKKPRPLYRFLNQEGGSQYETQCDYRSVISFA